tara:strand:+ start:68 stop:319 length:252 start_codon:yes stop_codon:yes gene_type:complete
MYDLNEKKAFEMVLHMANLWMESGCNTLERFTTDQDGEVRDWLADTLEWYSVNEDGYICGKVTEEDAYQAIKITLDHYREKYK